MLRVQVKQLRKPKRKPKLGMKMELLMALSQCRVVHQKTPSSPTPAPKTPSRATPLSRPSLAPCSCAPVSRPTLAPHSCAPLLLDNKEVTYLEMIAERRDKGLHEDQLQEHWAKLAQASQGNCMQYLMYSGGAPSAPEMNSGGGSWDWSQHGEQPQPWQIPACSYGCLPAGEHARRTL